MRRRHTAQQFVRLIQRSYAQGWETAVKLYDEVQNEEDHRKLARNFQKSIG
ncbi:MAG: hypothetical protein RIG62_19795 [Cyclobacteriaceae bacterium]